LTGRIAAVLLLGVAACTPAQNGTDGELPPSSRISADSRVTLERRPCFGFCPVYTVTITGSGAVTFDGERHVDSTGVHTHTIPADSARALIASIIDAGFFDLDDRYTMDAKGCAAYHTDAPTVILAVETGAGAKTVEHDYGCNGAPAVLRQLQERVDSVAGVRRWVGSRE